MSDEFQGSKDRDPNSDNAYQKYRAEQAKHKNDAPDFGRPQDKPIESKPIVNDDERGAAPKAPVNDAFPKSDAQSQGDVRASTREEPNKFSGPQVAEFQRQGSVNDQRQSGPDDKGPLPPGTKVGDPRFAQASTNDYRAIPADDGPDPFAREAGLTTSIQLVVDHAKALGDSMTSTLNEVRKHGRSAKAALASGDHRTAHAAIEALLGAISNRMGQFSAPHDLPRGGLHRGSDLSGGRRDYDVTDHSHQRVLATDY